MGRFYFHLSAGNEITLDEEGTELPDLSAAKGEAVLAARELLADAIKSGDRQAGQQAHTELDSLLANHAVIAPAGASENWSPTDHAFPVVAFADDGGYQWKQQMYADAAAGHPQNLIQSCRANGP